MFPSAVTNRRAGYASCPESSEKVAENRGNLRSPHTVTKPVILTRLTEVSGAQDPCQLRIHSSCWLWLGAQSEPSSNGERPGFSSGIFPCPVLSPCGQKHSLTLWQGATLQKCRVSRKGGTARPVPGGVAREARMTLLWDCVSQLSHSRPTPLPSLGNQFKDAAQVSCICEDTAGMHNMAFPLWHLCLYKS